MKKRTLILSILIALFCILPLAAGGSGETTSAATSDNGARPTLNEDGSFHLPIADEKTTQHQ